MPGTADPSSPPSASVAGTKRSHAHSGTPDSPEALSLLAGLRRLFAHATPRRKRQVALLLCIMVVGAFAEVLTLAAIMPFLALLSDATHVSEARYVGKLASAMGWSDPSDLVVPATLTFASAAAIAGCIRLVLTWSTTKLSLRFGHDLAVKVYENTLNQPYRYHTTANSSELIASIMKVQNLTGTVLRPSAEALVSFILATFILVALFAIDPFTASVSAGCFGSTYLLLRTLTRRRLTQNSVTIANQESKRIKTVQEGVGGIRDVLLDRVQGVYVKNFTEADLALQDCRTTNQVISAAPRIVIETFGIIMIAFVALASARASGGLEAALPSLGALALGAQKLLPLCQRVYEGWASATGSKGSIAHVVAKLELPRPTVAHQPLEPAPGAPRGIQLTDVHFSYAAGPSVLQDINLWIPHGSHLGIVGTTGSGKSTLTDIILGLLEPTRGSMSVDGILLDVSRIQAWQKRIAHVPQTIYLADCSLAENIAFGVRREEIDLAAVRDAARRVNLLDYIDSLPDGLQTEVGERGIRLSGGQRQRIGIARALYKRAEILVLDEATSALDSATESSVMDAIEGVRTDLTVVTIAHRSTTLSRCDEVVRIEAGRIAQRGSYAQVIKQERTVLNPLSNPLKGMHADEPTGHL